MRSPLHHHLGFTVLFQNFQRFQRLRLSFDTKATSAHCVASKSDLNNQHTHTSCVCRISLLFSSLLFSSLLFSGPETVRNFVRTKVRHVSDFLLSDRLPVVFHPPHVTSSLPRGSSDMSNNFPREFRRNRRWMLCPAFPL